MGYSGGIAAGIRAAAAAAGILLDDLTWWAGVPLCDWLCEHVGPPQSP